MPKVNFKSGGDTKTAEVSDGKFLKEVIRENDWPVLFACEEGVCGTCMIKVVQGKENLSTMAESEKQTLLAMGMDTNTYRLACQCKINGDVTVEQ